MTRNKEDALSLGDRDRSEVSTEELECKICYTQYNLQSRRPKLLECCHSLCSNCLTKILDVGGPCEAVCPFCRCTTSLQSNCVSELPDDRHLLSALTVHSSTQRNRPVSTELLLSPRALTSLVGSNSSLTPSLSSSTSYSSLRGTSSFVLITIMEPSPGPIMDSLVPLSWSCRASLCQSSGRALLWALGLLYFSSLPVGVYLLLLQRPTLGMLLVSLVPSSLALIIGYGLCQCLWHELRGCLFTDNTHILEF